MGPAGWIGNGKNKIFVDFGMILGLAYVSFWGPKMLNLFLSGLFPGHFVIDF